MVMAILIAFFMMPFLVHNLGDTWYGLWTIATSITGYYHLLDLGFASAVTRYIARHLANNESERANDVVTTSLVIYSVLAAVIIAVTAGISLFADAFVTSKADARILRLIILITGFDLAIEFPFKAFAGIIGANLRYDLQTYNHIFVLLLSTTLTVLLINAGYGVITLALIQLVCAQLTNVLFYLTSKRLFPELQVRAIHFQRTLIRKMFGYSIWSFLISISDQLRLRIAPVIIGLAMTAGAVTHYYVGARFVELFMQMVFRATNIMMPLFTQYHAEKNYAALREKLLFLTKINAILAFFGGGLLVILGKPFIARWMGPDYLDGYNVLVILTAGIVFEIIITPANNVLYAIAKHRNLAVVNIIEGVVSLVLCLVLVRHYGIAGVALGSIIPLVAGRLVALPIIVCRQVELPLGQFFIVIAKPLFFTAGYLFLYYLLTHNMLVRPDYGRMVAAALCAVPLYGASMLFIAFTTGERRMLWSMVGR
jgi:O-antigen/teichoic acid export membrane protein